MSCDKLSDRHRFHGLAGGDGSTTSRWAMRGFSEAPASDLARSRVGVILAVLAKMDNPYFSHNPGSQERTPSAQRMIRSLIPEEAGKAIVAGLRHGYPN